MARDFYAILSVSKNATADQIRERFRQLTRERHPDRFLGDQKTTAEGAFQEITQAFNVLSDPERRRQHDLELVRPREKDDPKQLARVYLQRGVKAYKEKNLLDAADNFDRATRADPGNAQGWFNLALTCVQNPAWLGRAMTAVERACELEPMNAGYWKQAGKICGLAGQGERAAACYRKAIEWGDDDPATQQTLEELAKPSRRSRFGKSG
ncbi:MAG TPA: DnaJ domain-containing protein [Thermoanaerobaculia bacterium]|nr:DnaJ domain-containing protein [Thermoanaerobaculia bacterium]